MDEFKIYRDGQYDKAANVRMKLGNKLSVLADQVYVTVKRVDDYFVNH